MTPRPVVLLLFALAPLLLLSIATADDGDSATLARQSLAVGEQVAVRLEVSTAVGQTVEVNPGGPAWNSVELVRVTGTTSRRVNDRALHTIDLVVASFAAGPIQFQPVVSVINGSEVSQRLLPSLSLNVFTGLGPNDPLEISNLAPPAEIEGAESPLLRPAIALGMLTLLLVVSALVFSVTRAIVRRPRG
ncbi:MAG: hypothetical protein ABIP13_00030, partial [Tepidiformaceae bacterium]